LGKLPSHRLFCFKKFPRQKQSSINLNTINTRILDICLFIKTEWKDIKERMKTIVKRSLVWLYKILNVRMTNQQEARSNLLNGGASIFHCIATWRQKSKEYKHQISFLHQIYSTRLQIHANSSVKTLIHSIWAKTSKCPQVLEHSWNSLH